MKNNKLLSFAFDSHAIRVVGPPEEPLFVGADVATALGFDHAPHAYRILDEDEKGVHKVDTPGGEQELTVITESGLYSLILRSKKPEAKLFKRWVTHEVLPSIRKTGTYTMKQKVKTLEYNNKYQAREIVNLMRRNIFASEDDFMLSRTLYWVYLMEGSYSKTAEKTGRTASFVSNRVKKYNHYLDGTRYERPKVSFASWDDTHPVMLFNEYEEMFNGYYHFLSQLYENSSTFISMTSIPKRGGQDV